LNIKKKNFLKIEHFLKIGDDVFSLPRPLQRPQAAHKLKKIINLNADISENIKDSELEFQI